MKDFCKLIFLYIIFGILSSIPIAYSQSESLDENYKVRMSNFSVDLSLPQSRYNSLLDKTGYGLSYTMLFQLEYEKPSFFGFDVHWHRYFGFVDSYTATIGGFNEFVEDRSTIATFGVHAVYRYYLDTPIPYIVFYIDGMLGANLLHTFNTITLESTDETVDVALNNANVVLNYGIGLGLQLNVSKNTYYLDFKSSYVQGTSGRYDILSSSNVLNQVRSSTNTFRFQIGLTYLH